MLVRWNLEVVPVPVSDLDRAKRFYAEQVGFHVDIDQWVADDQRIVQLTPPGSGCSIQLTSGTLPAGSLDGLQLVVSDVDAARTELVARNVDVSNVVHFAHGARVEGRGGEWNSFVFFDDPDGNTWVVQEGPHRD